MRKSHHFLIFFLILYLRATSSDGAPKRIINYDVPGDAQMIDMKFNHIPFVLANFIVRGKNYQGWLGWDTGSFANKDHVNPDGKKIETWDVIPITSAFLRQVGFLPAQEEIAIQNGNGKEIKVKVDITFVSDKKEFCTPGNEPTLISLDVGSERFEKLTIVGLEDIDKRMSELNTSASFGALKAIGIFPYPLMTKYLVSMDYKNMKIYLRPLNSSRRTFFETAALGQTDYVDDDKRVFCPVLLNGKFNGYGLIDTGAGDFHSARVNQALLKKVKVSSFKIGNYDFSTRNRKLKIKYTGQIDFNVRKDEIAWIGCGMFSGMFVTIDPKEHKIYFERDFDAEDAK